MSVVLVLNLALVCGLIVVGLSARSLGVLAEGVDYLADSAAIAVALLAVWLANRPPTAKRPHRYRGATTLAALVNGGWLLVLTVVVIGAAAERLLAGARQVHGLPVVVVSGIAAAIMIGGAVILRGDVDHLADTDDGDDLSMRAVLLDTAADAAAAAGVAASGGVILATGGLYWLDPTIALAVAVIVAYHAARLLRDVAAQLGETKPPDRSGIGPGGQRAE